MYPENWPKCPICGEPALDGKADCGKLGCRESIREAENQVTDEAFGRRFEAELPDWFGPDDGG